MKDAVILGGGVIGLSIAWRLVQQGLSVVVYDARSIGGESSWAGAGMLAPGGETESVTDFAKSLVESNDLYPSFVEELIAASGAPIDYRRCGSFEFAGNEDEWLNLLARSQTQRQLGIDSEIVKPGQIFYPRDAVVDPRHIVRALRIICERRGVEIREYHPVHAIRSEGGVIVEPRPAACAVLAAGAWSSSVVVSVDGERQPLVRSMPVRGHLVSWELEKEDVGPVLRQGATYIVQRSNGLTIGGSTHEHVGFDRTLDPVIIADIERRAARLFPSVAAVKRSSAWIGFRPFTEDGQAQAGRLGDSPVYLAYGHYRNGILLAPWVSRSLAALIANSQMGSILPAGHR